MRGERRRQYNEALSRIDQKACIAIASMCVAIVAGYSSVEQLITNPHGLKVAAFLAGLTVGAGNTALKSIRAVRQSDEKLHDLRAPGYRDDS